MKTLLRCMMTGVLNSTLVMLDNSQTVCIGVLDGQGHLTQVYSMMTSEYG